MTDTYDEVLNVIAILYRSAELEGRSEDATFWADRSDAICRFLAKGGR